jgi:hypothetical protein
MATNRNITICGPQLLQLFWSKAARFGAKISRSYSSASYVFPRRTPLITAPTKSLEEMRNPWAGEPRNRTG